MEFNAGMAGQLEQQMVVEQLEASSLGSTAVVQATSKTVVATLPKISGNRTCSLTFPVGGIIARSLLSSLSGGHSERPRLRHNRGQFPTPD